MIIPPDDWNAEVRIIWNVHRTALRCIGDKVKMVRDKWAAALPGLSLAAAWRTGKNLCDTPQWVTNFALAARRANFQSADLKSILDALMSKDMTKVAPATIRKMLDRAVKVAPPPTRQDPVAASLTSVGGTLLNAAAADRAAMRGAVETPAVRESEPAPMDVDSEKDSDSSIDLNAISINDDAAMWWAVQETARQCVSARLRTHYGNASETLSFIEQSLREVRHTKTPTSRGCQKRAADKCAQHDGHVAPLGVRSGSRASDVQCLRGYLQLTASRQVGGELLQAQQSRSALTGCGVSKKPRWVPRRAAATSLWAQTSRYRESKAPSRR